MASPTFPNSPASPAPSPPPKSPKISLAADYDDDDVLVVRELPPTAGNKSSVCSTLLTGMRDFMMQGQFVRYADIVKAALTAAAALPDPPAVVWRPNTDCEQLPSEIFESADKLSWRVDAANKEAVLCHLGLAAVASKFGDKHTVRFRGAFGRLVNEVLQPQLTKNGITATAHFGEDRQLRVVFSSNSA